MGLFSDLPAIFTGIFNEGDQVAVTPVDGSVRDASGLAIFRRASSMVMAEEADLVTSGPELHMAAADCADLDDGALVDVTTNAQPVEHFRVTARYPDGRGMVRFTLHEV